MLRPLHSASASRRVSSSKLPLTSSNGETTESLSASLKHETDQKEQLLVQVQNKDQIITTLTTENHELTSALNTAESRLNELYTEQSRAELDLAQRIELVEKLRSQMRELEKEKRDTQRRYNEQTATFEAERQSFYDNEQHLKSRIQSLTTQVRKQAELVSVPFEPDVVEPDKEKVDEGSTPLPIVQDLNDPETEPAEMTSLRLELSTLSTSYSSMQSTLVLLQTQLVDLKRVNNELQEENESYMILLREKTLSGQFDLMRQVGGSHSSDVGDDDDDDPAGGTDGGSLHSTNRSTLDRVEEEASEDNLEPEFDPHLGFDTKSVESTSRQSSRHGRRRTASIGPTRGESLAGLPISGPGLDLAAELGRAENKDMFDESAIEERSIGKGRRGKKSIDGRKVSSGSAGGMEASGSVDDIDALKSELKSLKDANKALSLYASKIIDRIISQEGFEHVLAVDYEKEPSSAGLTSPVPKPAKTRPQSVIVGRSTSSPMPETRVYSPPMDKPNPKVQRRSLSFDWKNFSLFGAQAEKKPEPNLRPLTLKPGAASVTGARKLDNQEDEEDRKERERMNATMKLMGIQPQTPTQLNPSFSFPASPAVERNSSTSSVETPPTTATTNNRRFSWFSSKPAAHSDASSIKSTTPSMEGSTHSGLGLGIPNLTRGALEQAEAESSLASLDARERTLSAEIARGANGGFTEIAPRVGGSRRGRRSAGGSSGSTTNQPAQMTSAPTPKDLPPDTLDFAHRMFEAARTGNSDLLLAAVDAGLPVNLTNDKGLLVAKSLDNVSNQPSGNTLLMLAAYAGHTDLTKQLLRRNGDPNRLNDLGQSIVAGAVFKAHDEIVRALIDEGADPRIGTPNAIQAAHMFGRGELMELLGAKEGDIGHEVPTPPSAQQK
ncbi:hypothetical protein H0H93_004212 [Arthromyces matolae]|nr:hypothetical protein H0H93_004212 [Arthromyces matolae]